MPAGAWEPDILAGRVEGYQPEWLDQLSFSGELVWGRLRPPLKAEEEEPSSSGLTRVVPIALAFREDLPWLLPTDRGETQARTEAQSVYDALRQHGALFLSDLAAATGLLPTRLEDALSELAALGLVTADGVAALRSLGTKRRAEKNRRRFYGSRLSPSGVERRPVDAVSGPRSRDEQGRPAFAEVVVAASPSVRHRVPGFAHARNRGAVVVGARAGLSSDGGARRNSRGPFRVRRGRRTIRVAGSGRRIQPPARRRSELGRHLRGRPIEFWWAFPFHGAQVPATQGNRLLFRDGRPVAALQAGELRFFAEFDDATKGKKFPACCASTQLPQLREELLERPLRQNRRIFFRCHMSPRRTPGLRALIRL